MKLMIVTLVFLFTWKFTNYQTIHEIPGPNYILESTSLASYSVFTGP